MRGDIFGVNVSTTEMVLATIIDAFKFEFIEGKEIIWNLGGIQTPAVKGAEAQTPHMPLRVSPAKP